MTDVVKLRFEGRDIEAPEGASVLQALESAGVAVDSSCRAGVCQSCLLQCVEGELPRAAQAGLSKALVAEGGFLACVCVPTVPLSIARAGALRQRVAARLQDRHWLSPTVLRLRLATEAPFSCRAGQFVTLSLPGEDLARSYSIAACEDGLLEFHVRVLPDGRMSQRLAGDLPADAPLVVSGPSGTCCYRDIDPDRRLVLAGTGTGLAPLWGILHDAIGSGHRGPIHLYHGALSEAGFYLVDELRALEARHPAFHYRPGMNDLVGFVADCEREVAGSDFFLCGDANLVNRLKRALYLAGARLDRLHADPFVAAQVPVRR